MNLKKIKAIARLMNESDVAEVETTDFFGLFRLFLRKGLNNKQPIKNKARPAKKTTWRDKQKVNPDDNLKPGQVLIKSPSVGTFHLINPEENSSKPLVKVGQRIEEEQIIAFIEALKINRPLASPFKGEVIKILVKHQNPVEYGQPLFLVKVD